MRGKERKMRLLDIVITHSTEEWGIGRKMFEMLKLQRGVDWQEVGVIVVQDGEEGNQVDFGRVMKIYPFVESVLYIPKGGVSEARNEGLRYAEAEWVMFCDFDDCLYSADSLHRILESLKETEGRADLVWSDFWIEMVSAEGKWIKRNKGWNTVFIHGKCYRREFLTEHNIWFDPELTYSEDAMFNALVAMEIRPERVAKMPETVYMWCFRPGSASNYEGGDEKRNESLYRKRVKTCEAYEDRGMHYDANTAAVRMLLDYYWELNGQDDVAGNTREGWIKRIQEDVLKRWPGCVMSISARDRKLLLDVTTEEAKARQKIKEGMITPEEWLAEIGAV